MAIPVFYRRPNQVHSDETRVSLLGSGILERARSTSLALLGATAAVGLAIVALALQQGWPLVAGSPIPEISRATPAVGDAAVVSRAASSGVAPARVEVTPRPVAGDRGTAGGGTAAGGGSVGAGELVAAAPVSTPPVGDAPPVVIPDPPVAAAPEPPAPSVQSPAPAPSEPTDQDDAPAASLPAVVISTIGGGAGGGQGGNGGNHGGHSPSTAGLIPDVVLPPPLAAPEPDLPIPDLGGSGSHGSSVDSIVDAVLGRDRGRR